MWMSVIRFPWFVVILILTSLPFYIASAASQASENSIESKTAIEQSIADGNYDFAVKTSLQQKNGYLFELISKAKEKSLASTPTWKILALYKPDYFFGVTSQVDGQEFFLSTQGKTNPEAELNATLAGFFSNKPIGSTTLSPQCRFPARYYWLKQQLGFADERLPEQQCRKFELFKQALNAKTITVVFPSAHPNSPSSMFGHTLLRFDKAGQTNQTRMLAYSDNYAANVDTKNGAIYAIKGLTGGFIGRFSVVPYYIKLREYAQMENRDIWEYRMLIL